MSRLLLHCALCGRRQASGLLSQAAWGRVVFTDGKNMTACPMCREQYPDWEERLRAEGEGTPPRFGGGYRAT